jgi:XTP/dITP diphosphohydrolase
MPSQKQRVLYVASNNQHKIEEIKALAGPAWDIKTAHEACPGLSWDETGNTFLENAKIKAAAVRQHTKACVLADDSGLVVEALGGAPGVWSSCYASREGDDAANNAKLLREMAGIPREKRNAHFICTLLFVDESGAEQVFIGKCQGKILESPRGQQGFGYDPLFEISGQHGRSLAELTDHEKNLVSHRYQAMQQWKKFIGCF